MSERVEQIRSMLEANPEDVFLHYSLAREYASAKRFDEAVVEFRKCIELDEQYLPAYVETGKALRSVGRLDEARETFATGMELAVSLSEKHMRDYIQQQLDALPRGP